MTDVRLTAVCKRFATRSRGDVTALDQCDVHIPSGQCTVLVGPSGCGKTTLLRLIAGLETPSSGTIHIGGRDVGGVAPCDRGVAMVLQDCAVYPHLSVRGNLRYPLEQRRRASWLASLASGAARTRRRQEAGSIADRIDAVASMLNLNGLLDRRPEELSGGEVQRLALGRALVVQPRVLLADEPLSHLDAALRAELQLELRQLYRQLGMTVVHVTHDQAEAAALGDHMVAVGKGGKSQGVSGEFLGEDGRAC